MSHAKAGGSDTRSLAFGNDFVRNDGSVGKSEQKAGGTGDMLSGLIGTAKTTLNLEVQLP